jgi:cation diffusion facilitator family transporter
MIITIPCCELIRKRQTRSNVQKFYKRQQYLEECLKEDELILKKSQNDHLAECADNERLKQKRDSLLAKLTLMVNVVMVAAKIFAAYVSNSLAVVSTVVDSLMDITSGAVIWMALRSIENTNREEYPVGKSRLEPLAIVITAMVMIFANLIVIYQSVLKTVTHELNPMVGLSTIIILSVGAAIKAVLYVLCRKQNTASSNALAQDQRNDVLTNTFALAAASMHHYWLYCDPLGAVLLSGYIIANWVFTAKEQVPLLIGKAASGEFMNRIAKIAISHDERILALDTIYVYHLGANYLVELHVLMPADLSLRDSHDVSEGLQKKIERLSYVERAFVHCDYEADGDEHLKKYK